MTRACVNCGSPMAPAARFCTVCGQAALIEPPAQQPPSASEGLEDEVLFGTSLGPVPAPAPPLAPPPPGYVIEPYAGGPQYALVRVQRTSGKAVAALVFGILTWALMSVLVGVVTGFITAPAAIALGFAGRRQVGDEPHLWRGSAQAMTGIILGLSWMLLATVVVSLMVFSSAGWF